MVLSRFVVIDFSLLEDVADFGIAEQVQPTLPMANSVGRYTGIRLFAPDVEFYLNARIDRDVAFSVDRDTV